MATPSLFPLFLKARSGGTGAGTVFIETLEIAVLDPIDVEVVDEVIAAEVMDLVDVEIVEDPIDVEVDC